MPAASNTRILIVGAGIAGAALAYWLVRHGFKPTLVEVAPALRTGGYMIDFWGVGYDVAEKMSLIGKLRSEGYAFTELRLVDETGRSVGGFDVRGLGEALRDRYFSILRADLSRAIFDAIGRDFEAIFGDSVAAIEQTSGALNVTFRSGTKREFDVVIGADGLHSAVRRLVFGEEHLVEKYLGYYSASFTAADYPKRTEGAYIAFTVPGRQIARYALRGNRTTFFFIFASDKKLDIPQHDVAAQKETLRRMFRGGGWESEGILAAMEAADELYFDSVSQIRMPAWSRGRVALIGDAAFCPSLLAGQGSAFAMAAAYLLAGELKRAAGNHAAAFDNFERQFRPFISKKQQGAERFGSWFAPRTRLGLRLRNVTTRMMGLPVIGGWMFRRMAADHFALPDYGR